jgi:hypothetical protein
LDGQRRLCVGQDVGAAAHPRAEPLAEHVQRRDVFLEAEWRDPFTWRTPPHADDY